MKSSAETKLVPLCEIGQKQVVLSVNIGADADVYHQHVAGGHVQHEHTWRYAFGWVNPGDVVLDLGANIGTISVALAAKGASVYGFEMLEENLAHLRSSIDANGLTALHLVEGAVSDYRGVIEIGGESAWGTLAPGSGKTVETVVIDQWAEEIGLDRLDFVKIDVEGSEMAALRGARELIQKYKPDMLIEANILTCGSSNYSYIEIMNFMENLGYHTYRISGDQIISPPLRPQECIYADYFFTTKSEADVADRSPFPVGKLSYEGVRSSIVQQGLYSRPHQAYVLTVADALPPEITTHPEVAELLKEWRKVDDSVELIEVLRIGAGITTSCESC